MSIWLFTIIVIIIIINSAWWVRKHETQSCSESCVFSFSSPILYTALHKCVLSTFWQCLLQLLMIIIIIIIIF